MDKSFYMSMRGHLACVPYSFKFPDDLCRVPLDGWQDCPQTPECMFPKDHSNVCVKIARPSSQVIYGSKILRVRFADAKQHMCG